MTELRPETRDMVAKATGLLLDGIFTSQVWDSSGEVLDLDGCDISEMDEGRGTANWEHRNDDSPGASASDTVGKIVYVKKVFKAEDCEDDRQRFFWAKVKAPYLYGIVRLYDGAGHAAAKDLAAQVRDAVANDEPIMVRFSIDGSTLERKGNQLKVTVARKVALTLKPCNKTCDSGLLADPNAPEGFEKEPKLVKSEDPLYGTLGWGEWVEQTLPQATLAKAADKATRNHWVSEDGVKVPKKGSPERLRYDAAFEKQVTKVFGQGKKIKVPVEHSTPHNGVRNYDRLQLYSDMLKGKDRLPPIVVRQGAFGWDVLDGSHRWAAAKAAGVTHLDAIDVTGQKVQKTAPSMLTGQAALTREDLSKRVESVLKSWDESKGPLKEFLKSQLSDVDPKYVQHFVDAADNIRAQLRKSQTQDLGYHVLLSGDNPKHAEAATMKLDNPGLVSHLQAHGEDVVSTEGRHEGLDERSMMVRNPKDLNHILDVATKLGQDSVIVSHGGRHQYVYLHGPNKGMAYHGEGTVWHSQKPDDFYTSLPDGRHFTHQFDWSQAHPFDQGLAKSEEDESKVDPKAPLTVRGQPVAPNPDVKPGEMHFNEHTGTLKTPRGTFTLYQPDKDGKSGEHFRQVWSSPHVRSQHDYAIRNWIKVNSALREGKLPEAVLATATAFSQLSPNTAVPTHELMYSHLLDTQKKFGIDTRSPEFASQKVKRDWLARDKPQSWPESSRSYFTDQIPSLVTVQADSKTTGRKAGDRVPFALANNKFDNMSRYADVHGVMRDLVSRHGVDGRAAVKEMMDSKVAATLWEAARKRHVEKGNPDIGPYKGPNVPGLAPKTARFTYAMLGSGNSFVPDTHFARHLFGLDKALDSPTIHHLRDGVLWNPKNSELLGAMDRWYYRNHPAVQLMLNHPEFGDYFKANPEQAVFGGFWGHWLSIKKHEELQGHRSAGVGSNQSASHRPFFDEIDRLMSDPRESKLTIPARTSPLATSSKPQDSLVFSTRGGHVKKSEAPDHGGSMIDPHLAAQMLAGWVRDHGEGEAMLRYYLHLVPLLMHEGHEAEDQGIELAKADALSVEILRLAKATADGTAPGWKMAADGSMVQRPKVKPQALPHTAEIDPKGSHAQNDSWEGRYGTRPHDVRTEVNEAVFDSELHGHVLNQTPEQKALIHGVRVHNAADRPKEGTANPVLFVPHPDGQRRVVAKNDVNSHTNGVAREVGYYNLARDFFGLGHYLPVTAGARHPDGKSNWSFSEMIPNARHWDENDQGQHQVLRDLGDRGELHKMAFMNAVLGNSDRHLNNFMFDERPGEQPLKLIDHGHAFTTTNEPTMNWSKTSAAINGIAPTPGYLSAYMQAAPHASHELHPAARQWIEALRPEDLRQRATAMGLGARTSDWLARNLQANKDHFLNGKGTVRGINVPVDKED